MAEVARDHNYGAVTAEPLAFVFAGGGSLGAIEVGMLEALAASGIRPDFVVGASVGAINGAHYAADPTPSGVERLRGIWQRVTRADVFPFSVFGALKGLLGSRQSLLDSAPLRALLVRNLPGGSLEESAIPCVVTATDALDGSEVILRTGLTVEALLASAAIPVLFPPVERDGRFLLDGGVASNTPIAAAVALGARRIIVLPTGYSCALPQPPRSMIAMVLHTFNLLIARQLVVDIERFAGRAEIAVVPPLCPLASSSYDFSHATILMDRARATTSAWLDAGGLDRAGSVPASLGAHQHGDRVVPGRDDHGASGEPSHGARC